MTELAAVAEKHGLQMFEDAAQAHGASWAGAPVGTFGTFAMFSLYPTKNMTSGEGGMVSCADGRGRAGAAAAPQPGHGAPVRERGRRLQRPDDRHARRDRPGAARQAGGLDRAAAGERALPRSEPARASTMPPVADGRNARLPPVHDPGARGPRRLRERRCTTSTASAPASTTRSRTTGCPRSGSTLDLPETERAARRGALAAGAPVAVATKTWTGSSTAVNAVAKAGA